MFVTWLTMTFVRPDAFALFGGEGTRKRILTDQNSKNTMPSPKNKKTFANEAFPPTQIADEEMIDPTQKCGTVEEHKIFTPGGNNVKESVSDLSFDFKQIKILGDYLKKTHPQV